MLVSPARANDLIAVLAVENGEGEEEEQPSSSRTNFFS